MLKDDVNKDNNLPIEKIQYSKLTYSASSLADKNEVITYKLCDCKKKKDDDTFFVVEMNNIFSNINSIIVNKKQNIMTVNYLKHKRNRNSFNKNIKQNNSINLEEQFYLDTSNNITNIIENENDIENEKIDLESFEYKINQLNINFYENESFNQFKNLEDYTELLNHIFFNQIDVPQSLELVLKNIKNTIFDNEFNKNIISLNKIENTYNEQITLKPCIIPA